MRELRAWRACVVGRGKVGRALARALEQAAVPCRLVAGRKLPRQLDGDVFLLAVPDAQLLAVASALSPRIPRGSVVLQLAGGLALDALRAALQPTGQHVALFHPLLSFADRRVAPSFVGATFTSFGDPKALTVARRLAGALSAHLAVLKEAPGPAYHAAAALLANGAAALAYDSRRALEAVGFTERAAERALSTLLASVAVNIAQLGLPNALTGPVSRGDSAAVSAHLTALTRIDPELAQHYAALLPAIVQTALAQGLAPERAARVRDALAAHVASDASHARASVRRNARASVRRKAQVTK